MRIITGFLGRLMMVLGGILTIPLLYAVIAGEKLCILPFLLTAAGSAGAGFVLHLTRNHRSPSTAQAMIVCTLSWVILSILGAVPFVLILDAGWIDSVFETMSGFTTTGITMFSGLDSLPHSLILWRTLTQWVGGLGILTFFLAVASQVPGAHKLMGAESNKIFSGRPVPGLLHTVKILWTIYSLFTLVVAVALKFSGMNLFDSLNHALCTISTGGFSPHDASIAWYQTTGTGNHVLIEYILIAGMIAGGINFLVHYRVFHGVGLRALFTGAEIKLWWSLLAAFTGLILIEQHLVQGIDVRQFWQTLRIVLFQVTAVLTGTGFRTEDIYSPFFGQIARQLFLVMMVIGGCVGSTSGGIKVLRISILWKVSVEQIRKICRAERAVSGTRLDGQMLERSEISRIAGILFLWLLILVTGGAITAFLAPELDSYTAYSGIFSALGNVGPTLMTVDQMANLHSVIKVTYIFAMLAGRLEILPVLLLFSRRAWK